MDKNKTKVIFEETLMISTGIFFMVGIGGVITHLSGGEYSLDWYHPLSIIFISFLCSLPTLFLREMDGGKSEVWRVVLHCLSLFAVVSFAGWIFKWYTDISGYISVVIIFMVVYIFVWLSSIWMGKVDENKINKALKDFHDEE
ncbi:MAG: DUF3021 family protein [Lachnospiraceae bacterium]|nr:DUF3021 family protein [Lachnospiraceae bacterium]MBQ9234353.1 DUF3021 family protein [Lachnospiraceae bacterium]